MQGNKLGNSSVTLPNDLLFQIDFVIKNANLGFKSRAEFVKGAIRKELAELSEKFNLEFNSDQLTDQETVKA